MAAVCRPQTVEKPFSGSCQRGRTPSDWIRIDRLCRSGGEFSALPKTFLQSFVRKARLTTIFSDGLRAAVCRPAYPILFSSV